MTVIQPDPSLEDIRREIDAIDDSILDLVARRFAATGRVRNTKRNDGSLMSSPLRPAREAAILRRLAERANGQIEPQLLVRLWRVILSASTIDQAPVVLHIDSSMANDTPTRILIAEHFCDMEVVVHPKIDDAFEFLRHQKGDLTIAQTSSRWADCLAESSSEGVRLIGSLPILNPRRPPGLLIFGHAEPQPTGHDETILICKSIESFKEGPELRWQIRSGNWNVSSLSGFLQADKPAIAGLMQSRPAEHIIIAGSYPCSIEIPA